MAPVLLCVRKSRPQFIVPESTEPRDIRQVSDIDDQGSLRVQVPVMMVYKKNEEMRGVDPVESIRRGLGKALDFYYHLAGRIIEGQNRKLVVKCLDEIGVWFVGAKANVELDELGVESFHPPCPYFKKVLVPNVKEISDRPLIHIQVTRFKCGGFVLALRFNHTMMDTQGLVQFLNSMTELAHGEATAPSILPVWERELLSARATPRITCSHKQFEDSDESSLSMFHGTSLSVDVEKLLKNLRKLFGKKLMFRTLMLKRSFTFGSREIEAIKDQCPENCTKFEALAACLWKCRTEALQPHPGATVKLTFVVNIRDRLQGGLFELPRGYYGNTSVSAAAATTAGLLCANSVAYAAELIREANNGVNEDYVKSVADLMVLKRRPEMSVLRNFFIADNTRLGIDEVDFGWGRPMFGGVVSVGYGVGYLVPHNRMEDEEGVLIALALPPIVMGRFQDEIRKMIRA